MEFPLSLMLDPGAVGVLRYYLPFDPYRRFDQDGIFLTLSATNTTTLMNLLCSLDMVSHWRSECTCLDWRLQYRGCWMVGI